MNRRRAVVGLRAVPSAALGPAVAALLMAGAAAVIAIGPGDRVNSLSIVLGIAAVLAGALIVTSGLFEVSAAFIVCALAAAFLGPASAALASIVAEAASVAVARTRIRVTFFINLPAGVVPAVLEGWLIRSMYSQPTDSIGFYALVAAAAIGGNTLSFAVFAVLRRINLPDLAVVRFRDLIDVVPGAAISVLLTIAGVGIELEIGDAAIAFALAAVFAFAYMMMLLQKSRDRAESYAALSWGVLAGLLRALDLRDGSASRHAAAVARFSRDIARLAGFSDAECELAHTAGLLHDIGRFALSDRVAERGRTLTDEDWMAIQQHPQLGAEMLRDLGMYGPVAEIVVAHHERIDGRGYPHGLTGEEIPELAKIIAVAEVYDTLTAGDTYRTQVSSFEALNELRRVAGSQLDVGYVEVLSELLAGEGVDYRHADLVDFDAELDMERRIREASGGGRGSVSVSGG